MNISIKLILFALIINIAFLGNGKPALSSLSLQLNKLAHLRHNIIADYEDAHQIGLTAIGKSKLKSLTTKPDELLGPSIGYIFIGPKYFKGKINKVLLQNYRRYRNRNTPEAKEIAHQLVNNYKIHLMPKSVDALIEIIKRIFDDIATNSKLINIIGGMKFKYPIDFNSTENIKKSITQYITPDFSEIMPIMVVYPSSDKSNAEYLLNHLLQSLKGIPGVDIIPRYNQKVTDLIYYAQGAGDDKDTFSEYFDESKNKALYVKNFEGQDLKKDYSLKIWTSSLQ